MRFLKMRFDLRLVILILGSNTGYKGLADISTIQEVCIDYSRKPLTAFHLPQSLKIR